MIPAIKTEIFKLLTVRSTYVIMLISLGLVTFMSFYLEGYWGQTGTAAGTLQPTAIMEIMRNNMGIIAMFVSIIAILQTGHEYRHNTIMFTLTAVASRTKIFLAKAIVMGGFALLFGLIATIFGIAMYYFGLGLRGATLPAQDINLIAELPKFGFYILVYGLLGLFLTLLIRNLIGAIVFILIYPIMIEPILSLLLKSKGAYLPVSTFDHIVGVAMQQNESLTPGRATLLSFIYISILGILAWLSFVRRDAN